MHSSMPVSSSVSCQKKKDVFCVKVKDVAFLEVCCSFKEKALGSQNYNFSKEMRNFLTIEAAVIAY